MRGTLYGIGVGPGEPELMTLKALRILKESAVVILPAAPKEECYAYKTAYAIYPEIAQKESIALPFPMIKDEEKLAAAHNHIYEEISAQLEQGKHTAFLTIGDPSVYATYSYVHKRELANGGTPVMVSGVPSFCAAAAALGISLGDNKEQIHVIPASFDIEATRKLKGTRIYMKSGKTLGRLKEMLLLDTTEHSGYEVYSITNVGMPGERTAVGAEHIDANSGYLTIVIVKENEHYASN